MPPRTKKILNERIAAAYRAKVWNKELGQQQKKTVGLHEVFEAGLFSAVEGMEFSGIGEARRMVGRAIIEIETIEDCIGQTRNRVFALRKDGA